MQLNDVGYDIGTQLSHKYQLCSEINSITQFLFLKFH